MANDSTLSNLNPITNVTDASLFYCVLNGSDFKATGAQLLAYMKAGLVIPVTQAQYDDLTPQQRANGSIYLITDGDPIHDLPFPQSVDRTAEVAVYIPNVGLRKVLYSQLETVLQGDTEIGDLKDVTISSLANGDVLTYDSTGGADGEGGWVNKSLSGMFLTRTYTATKTVAANGVVALLGSDMDYNSIPNGYTPIVYTFSCTNSNDLFCNLYSLTGTGSTQFAVIRNVSASAQNDRICNVNITFVKSEFL